MCPLASYEEKIYKPWMWCPHNKIACKISRFIDEYRKDKNSWFTEKKEREKLL